MPYSEKAQEAYKKLKAKASGFNPTLKSFFITYTGLCIYTAVIWIAFWCLGFPSVLKGGFPIITDYMRINEMPQNSVGAILSGAYGSGTFPCSLFLLLLSTFMLIKEYISYFYHPSILELERRADVASFSKYCSSMRQMSTLRKEDMMSIGVEAASLNPQE
ncbi:uncharacterized protein [Blastocystis hominis]|uniref:Uncharacterized protein n=1 Tax=Blastocystis hominis TaxID=12968 RepID=D8MAZ0_BLAHO|nr:uncharacterized protein [Blastocystis hominis]CBK25229.2 unnamed protein product [Blastocystis hominis]|eukprot:XP_012899277.1 uncharacterized protein [Blastocystis hominis]